VGDAARRRSLPGIGAHDVPAACGQRRVRERRDQLAHPACQRPELLAERPNELHSCDITKLLGPAKWTYYYLYVILDVYSRYAVGWTVQHRESSQVAKALIAQTCEHQQIKPNQLTVHADRGTSMTSKPVAMLLTDLGVTKSHSRPYTSTDNPYSEYRRWAASQPPGDRAHRLTAGAGNRDLLPL
jgi:putative transposase